MRTKYGYEEAPLEEFKHGLLVAIDQQLKTGCDYVRQHFCNHLYTMPHVISDMSVDGTFGDWYRNVIINLFPEMGELVCARMRML